MILAITPAGVVSNLSKDYLGETNWDDACIHIFPRERSVLVSVDFSRLTASATAAALFEIADLRPTEITLFGNDNGMTEVLAGFQPAFQRLCDIFSTILSEEDGQSHIGGQTTVEADTSEAMLRNHDSWTRRRHH